jgi:hypothetical protein
MIGERLVNVKTVDDVWKRPTDCPPDDATEVSRPSPGGLRWRPEGRAGLAGSLT